RHCGVRDVVVVRGYKKERVSLPGLRFVDNDRYAETGEVGSLFGAERELDGPFVLLYGDILFDPAILVKLLQTKADVAVVVDRAFHDAYRAGLGLPAGPLDLVVTETPPNGRRFFAPAGGSRVVRLRPQASPGEAHGGLLAMAMFAAAAATALRAVHREL